MTNARLAIGTCPRMGVEIVNAILSAHSTSIATSSPDNVSVSRESPGRNALNVKWDSSDSMRKVVRGVTFARTKDLSVILSMVGVFARPTLQAGIA